MAKNKLPIASTMPSEPRETKTDEAREMKYRAEGALHDIERAKKHESDKELMKHVKKMAKDKIKCLGKI